MILNHGKRRADLLAVYRIRPANSPWTARGRQPGWCPPN